MSGIWNTSDSISQTSERVLVKNEWGAVRVTSFGPVICINVNWTSAAGEWNNEKVAQLPSGMEPPTALNTPFFRNNSSGLGDISLAVEADGSIRVVNHGGTQKQGEYIAAALTWIAK